MGYALFAVGTWGEDILITDVEELENLASVKYISKDWMQKNSDNPNRWRICISCGRWFSKIIREKTTNSKNPL